jgi:asparagine synthase (glutamine-hydrolysing)
MCGITGIIDFTNTLHIDEHLLRKMSEPLKFRGPDQEGYTLHRTASLTCGLAHKRLSVIDVSESGRQPMWSSNQTHAIVFNGEIYNYQELKSELIKENVRFHTSSDTEVVLNAYSAWGMKKTLNALEGMFAIALLDLEEEKIFLARDRFGEKPLYYHAKTDFFAFSSDIRSFKSLDISLNLDLHALGYFFSEMSTPIENSIYQEIKKLPPAHYLDISKKGLELKEYWNLNYRTKSNLAIEETIEQAEFLIEKAVQKTLVSDVPIGCFLSGGLDSSLVSWYAAKNYGQQLKTFSVGFEYESFNELPYAQQVAKQIDSEHHEIILNPNDLKTVGDLLREFGEPFADSSAIPTYYVAKFAASKVKVALGGDGGDELFAGYRTYNQGWRMQQWFNRQFLRRPLSSIKKFSSAYKVDYLLGVMQREPRVLASALHRNMGFSQGDLKYLWDNDLFYNATQNEHHRIVAKSLLKTEDVFDTLLHASIHTRLPNDYLVKTDRAAMFNSLELRAPFLDKNLIEFTQGVRYNALMHQGTNKFITKKIAERYFSKEFVHRQKQGFGIPIGQWVRKEWKKNAAEVILSNKTDLPFNLTFIEKMWNEHQSGKMDHTHRLWIVYVWNLWSSQQ